MKKILLLENKGEVSFYLEKDLTNKGYMVYEAMDILDAKSIIREEGKMDCYVIDMNLRSKGLTEDQKKDTKDGVITGWIWFRDYIIPNDESARNKCVIFSDYLSPLRQYVSPNELEGIYLVPKRGTGRESFTLDQAINRILS